MNQISGGRFEWRSNYLDTSEGPACKGMSHLSHMLGPLKGRPEESVFTPVEQKSPLPVLCPLPHKCDYMQSTSAILIYRFSKNPITFFIHCKIQQFGFT